MFRALRGPLVTSHALNQICLHGSLVAQICTFVVVGVNREILGSIHSKVTCTAAEVSLAAHNLAAEKYGVKKAEVCLLGIQFEGNPLLSSPSDLMNMSVQELQMKNAEFHFLPQHGTLSPAFQDSIDSFRAEMKGMQRDIYELKESGEKKSRAILELKESDEMKSSAIFELMESVKEFKKSDEVMSRVIFELQSVTLHPLYIRQLCVESEGKIRAWSNPEDGRKIIKQRTEAPKWATDWFDKNGQSEGLDKFDLGTIFISTTDSVRGDGNMAAHEIDAKKQAEAVSAQPDEKTRSSLFRIFKFRHNKSPLLYIE